jgi:malonyl-CoA O-methyltransferase
MKPTIKAPSTVQMHLDSRSAYDRWSHSYDGHPNPTVALARLALETELPSAQGLDVLEFGCGTGENLVALGGRGASVLWGVDISEGMLARARGKLKKFNSHLHHVEMDELSFGTSAKFNLVLAILVLEHVEDIDRFFQLAAKGIAEGGVVYVSELHPVQSARGIKAKFRDSDGAQVSTDSYHRAEGEFVASARKAGLEAVSVRAWSPDADFVKLQPKAEKFLGEALLLTMSFRKI